MKKPARIVSFDATSSNFSADLLELTLYAPQGASERDFFVGADVRFGSMTVSSDDWNKSVEVGLSSATLRLELQGCLLVALVHLQPRLQRQNQEARETQRAYCRPFQTL